MLADIMLLSAVAARMLEVFLLAALALLLLLARQSEQFKNHNA